MKKHLKSINLKQFDQAVKFLTRPFDNKLSLDQATAIQTLLDRIEYSNKDREFQSGKLSKLRNENFQMESVIKNMIAETNNRLAENA